MKPINITEKNQKKRIGIFSGSFNPVHTGHQKLAEYLIDNRIIDEVWFIVSPCNPLKKPDDMLDENIRLDMLMLAISHQKSFKASDIEFTMPIPSYSIDTLHKLTSIYPDFQFVLLIGSDNALVFDQWKNYTQILSEYPVMVYPRLDHDFRQVSELYPQMQLLKSPYFKISSTKIREFIRQKKDVSQWLHPSVYQYIIDKNLYQ
jgi:nicotinate-nucleotide adenylyltransferase